MSLELFESFITYFGLWRLKNDHKLTNLEQDNRKNFFNQNFSKNMEVEASLSACIKRSKESQF